MRNLIKIKIKSKLNFRIHKLNDEITVSNINCNKKKKKKKNLSQKNVNEEKKYNWLTLMFIADDHSMFITIVGI
jgi:hypothetical protein